MAVEFLVAKDCKFKAENESNSKFIFDLIKKSNFVDNMPRFLKAQTKKSDEEILDLKVTFEEFGIISKSIREIAQEIGPNLFWCESCKECIGNASNEKFGCYGRVSYPISAEFEQLLISKLPSKESIAYSFLKKSINDFPVDFKNLNQMRGSNLFELKSGVSVKIKESIFKSFEVSSDNILNMLFLSGNTLGVSHMMMMCLFLGLIPDTTSLDQLRDQEYLKKELFKSLKENHFRYSKENLLINSLIVSVISNVPLSISV